MIKKNPKTVHVQICTKISWGKTKKQPKYQQVYLAKKQQILGVQSCLTFCRVAHQTPLSMGSPGNSIGVGCHFLHQGIFLTQGSNPCLCVSTLAGGFLTSGPPGKPFFVHKFFFIEIEKYIFFSKICNYQ